MAVERRSPPVADVLDLRGAAGSGRSPGSSWAVPAGLSFGRAGSDDCLRRTRTRLADTLFASWSTYLGVVSGWRSAPSTTAGRLREPARELAANDRPMARRAGRSPAGTATVAQAARPAAARRRSPAAAWSRAREGLPARPQLSSRLIPAMDRSPPGSAGLNADDQTRYAGMARTCRQRHRAPDPGESSARTSKFDRRASTPRSGGSSIRSAYERAFRPTAADPDGPTGGACADWRTRLGLSGGITSLSDASERGCLSGALLAAGRFFAREQREPVREEPSDDVDHLVVGDVGLGVLRESLDLEVVFRRVLADPLEHGLADGWRCTAPSAAVSCCIGGTGRAFGTGHVLGSRGVSRVKTLEKVRAAASRAVNGSPRPHCSRSVAISEVWRYSSLNTSPSATHGDTMIAGTR